MGVLPPPLIGLSFGTSIDEVEAVMPGITERRVVLEGYAPAERSVLEQLRPPQLPLI